MNHSPTFFKKQPVTQLQSLHAQHRDTNGTRWNCGTYAADVLKAIIINMLSLVPPENVRKFFTHSATFCFLMSSIVSASPASFDPNTKQDIITAQNERVSSLYNISSTLFILHMTERKRYQEFFSTVAQTSFETLMERISSSLIYSEAGRNVMHCHQQSFSLFFTLFQIHSHWKRSMQYYPFFFFFFFFFFFYWI